MTKHGDFWETQGWIETAVTEKQESQIVPSIMKRFKTLGEI